MTKCVFLKQPCSADTKCFRGGESMELQHVEHSGRLRMASSEANFNTVRAFNHLPRQGSNYELL